MKPVLKRSLTLIELMIAISLLSILILAFGSLELFSRRHVVTLDRQAALQNEASLALEHMSINVQRGVGYPIIRPALAIHTTLGITDGFSVFIEPGAPGTPTNPADDFRVDYILGGLGGTTLTCTVTNPLPAPAVISTETFSTHIRPGVANPATLPLLLPVFPSGLYINITNGSMIEVSLVARWQPANRVNLDNPQVVLKSSLYTRSSAAR